MRRGRHAHNPSWQTKGREGDGKHTPLFTALRELEGTEGGKFKEGKILRGKIITTIEPLDADVGCRKSTESKKVKQKLVPMFWAPFNNDRGGRMNNTKEMSIVALNKNPNSDFRLVAREREKKGRASLTFLFALRSFFFDRTRAM